MKTPPVEPVRKAKSCREFDIRLIDAGTPIHRAALHLVLGERPLTTATAAPAVAELLATAERGKVDIDSFLGAFDGSELITAALAVKSCGGAALVSIPSAVGSEVKYRATVELLRSLRELSWRRSMVILEALTAPGTRNLGLALREAGFRHLTRLLYLKLGQASPPHAAPPRSDWEWLSYTPQRRSLFVDALDRSYVQSMDCQELTGLRDTSDVLAGHQAVGHFDPTLWWVIMWRGEPIGVLLLNRFSNGDGLEIVYTGVAQVERGKGVGDALLQRAVELARRDKAKVIALAVDQRNVPARRMYARWGFTQTAARDAWIAIAPSTGT